MNFTKTPKKLSPKKELDNLCLDIVRVDNILNSNKTPLEKFKLISKKIQYISVIMANQKEDLILLKDLVAQWKTKTLKQCHEYMEKMNITTKAEKKNYLSVIMKGL